MSSVSEIRARAEALLADGVFDHDALLDAVMDLVEMDTDAMRRSIAKRRLSLAIATIRNDDGERMAYPAQDIEGKRVVLHMQHSRDHEAMNRLAVRKRKHAYTELRAADRLFERAHQLSFMDRLDEGAA